MSSQAITQSCPQVSQWSVSRTKRIFDALAAFVALLIAAPGMAVIALLVKCTSRGPVFFRQLRVGQNGVPFELLKFRTMRNMPGPAVTRSGDPRVTRVGKFLRRTKIDELPQLWNVVRGDMSLVGPRPDLPTFWPALCSCQPGIAHLRPGLTGRASLLLRDEEGLLGAIPEQDLHHYYTSHLLPQKALLDLEYAEAATFLSDIRIALATLRTVIHWH
jgi:lipopolysaccharide/colanic/teichoic acid biosynthesis glycosyltransferase